VRPEKETPSRRAAAQSQQQLASDGEECPVGGERSRDGAAGLSGDEVVVADLDGDAAGTRSVRAQLRGQAGDEAEEPRLQRIIGSQITREGLLVTHGFGRGVQFDLVSSMAANPFVEPPAAPPPEPLLEAARIDPERIAHRDQTIALECRLEPGANPGNVGEGELREERRLAAGGHDQHTGRSGARPRLGPLGGELGDQAIGSATDRDGETGRLMHRLAQPASGRAQGLIAVDAFGA
jgi:hypothetical protein